MPKVLKALDLYSGVGGWGLGLSMAGIKIVGSYELNDAANLTNKRNNRHAVHKVNIRELNIDRLPIDIDIVVGSPPCQQFSFANRGGNGNLKEGLEDIRRFLAIVQKLRPKFWAMENVPRVASILKKELTTRGRLRDFRDLKPQIAIISMSEFGLPQRRVRCIAGNFDFDLFQSYAKSLKTITMGDVIEQLSKKTARDAIYGIRLPSKELIEHTEEALLSPEEARINRASKALHPIYNGMPFPDRLDLPSRTVTATCTRVGRESIVLEDSKRNGFRRLTVRERASLQSFPVTFQFYSPSYREKLRLIGNAMPPLIAFYLGQAFNNIPSEDLKSPSSAISKFKAPIQKPPLTQLNVAHERRLAKRRFKFSIPSLRLKSGDRFELANEFYDQKAIWRVRFFFGKPKDIRSINLSKSLFTATTQTLPRDVRDEVNALFADLNKLLTVTDSNTLQQSWERHASNGGIKPLQLLDEISAHGDVLAAILGKHPDQARTAVIKALNGQAAKLDHTAGRLSKLLSNAPRVTAGILLGSLANSVLEKQDEGIQPT